MEVHRWQVWVGGGCKGARSPHGKIEKNCCLQRGEQCRNFPLDFNLMLKTVLYHAAHRKIETCHPYGSLTTISIPNNIEWYNFKSLKFHQNKVKALVWGLILLFVHHYSSFFFEPLIPIYFK